jgi:molybdate transport system ATP-binding protein
MRIDLAVTKTLRSGPRTFTLDVRCATDCERLVILGPSGAGKTLLLRAVAGLERPDAGHVRIDGATLFDHAAGIDRRPQERGLGFVFQDYALCPHLTERQNVAFGRARGWRTPARHARDPAVEEWLATLGLAEMAHQYPRELSGGQRQRTALARTLAGAPRALLLDEPFAALDAELRASTRTELAQLQRRLRLPTILITHDPEDARCFDAAVLHLRDGRLEQA